MQEQINMIMDTLEIMNENFKLMDNILNRLSERVSVLEEIIEDHANIVIYNKGDNK